MSLTLGMILTAVSAGGLVSTPHRVLQIDVQAQIAWCIELPRFRPDGRVAGYVRAPAALNLPDVITALDAGQLQQARFEPPGHWAFTDADYLAGDLSKPEKMRREQHIKRRDAAWEVIRPIIKGHTLCELLGDISVRQLVVERATVCKRSPATVYRLLHLYWAHGSVLNGLMPMTHRCGARGKERHPRKPMGRRPRLMKIDPEAPHQFIPSDDDKRHMGVAYAKTHQGMTSKCAYDQMNLFFYSDVAVNPDGTEIVELHPQHSRPTYRQFRYWGPKLAKSPEFRRKNGLPVIRSPRSHRGGSTRELADAVGQCAQFDGTSLDCYLTSIFSRLLTLPPPTRSILMEQRSGVMLAPYVSWESESSHTFLQTLYLGTTDKVEFCARFGIDIGPEDWPGMLCSNYFVDNGGARNEESLAVAEQLGFGIECAPSYSGAAKGDIESHHHADHKQLDHQLPGTTKGRQRERGQSPPADAALWNYYEYMREYLLGCIEFNNTEVKKGAPTELLAAGIRPTRINILKWLRAHGQCAELAFDINQVRAWTLPTWEATMHYNGIILKDPDTGTSISECRFMSDVLLGDARFIRAGQTRHVIPIRVKVQREFLGEIWLPSTQGLLRIPNVSSDDSLLRHGVLADLALHREREADLRARSQQNVDQAAVEKVARRETTTVAAALEFKAQGAASPGQASRSARRANLRTNATTEQAFISSPQFAQAPARPSDRQPAAPPSMSATPDEAASAAVAAFNSTLPPLESTRESS